MKFTDRFIESCSPRRTVSKSSRTTASLYGSRPPASRVSTIYSKPVKKPPPAPWEFDILEALFPQLAGESMNKALEFTNWRQGGKHYVLKASSENKWAGFQESVIIELKRKFGDDFFLVIWSEESNENDFYNIPFRKVCHLFTDDHKTTGKYPDRWTAIIWEDQFLMHSNSRLAVDIKEDYGNLHNEKAQMEWRVSEDLASYEIENEYFEGEKKSRLSSFYERSPKLRLAVIKIHGLTCKICDFNFKKVYGSRGDGFIEVHHLKPVSTLTKTTKVCPENDMIVVCPNCHRMLHRDKDSLLTPDQLKNLFYSQSEKTTC
jgi:predicted HNH restriction endonuclease